jgi:hypothetical protein
MIERELPNGAFERDDESDDCPYYPGGWGALARRGNPRSYRFMYDPDTGTCHAVPVPTPGALRDSIVAMEERS